MDFDEGNIQDMGGYGNDHGKFSNNYSYGTYL